MGEACDEWILGERGRERVTQSSKKVIGRVGMGEEERIEKVNAVLVC
jgi:hypothetical protein